MRSEIRTYFERANASIGGQVHLLSKHPKLYLPGLWPSHYESAKGIEVLDMSGRTFLDFSNMGVGACLFGYADEEIDNSVIDSIKKGVSASISVREEVELAEQLLEIHSWASKVRFARTGGEINAVAIRLARALTGKSAVAVSGYHGWHDWYLSANLAGGDGLQKVHIPGIGTNGVPETLVDSCYAFYEGDLSSLEELLRKKEIAAVIIEVSRYKPVDSDYLHAVKKLVVGAGALLIFDECTSGFRSRLAGCHLSTGVSPHICSYGKAMGNGYAITAALFSQDFDNQFDSSFISSTFWTERVGFSAAKATIAKMIRVEPFTDIAKTGKSIKETLASIINANRYESIVTGVDALPLVRIDNEITHTALVKKLLEKGILFSGQVYVSTLHGSYTDYFFEEFERSLKELNVLSPTEIERYVEHNVPRPLFGRLNQR